MLKDQVKEYVTYHDDLAKKIAIERKRNYDFRQKLWEIMEKSQKSSEDLYELQKILEQK